MKKIVKQAKGITLIALVVTIVIILILAGITLKLTIGNNSILARATRAAKDTRRAQAQDQIGLKFGESQITINEEANKDYEEMVYDVIESVKDAGVIGCNDMKEVFSDSYFSPKRKLVFNAQMQKNNRYYNADVTAIISRDDGKTVIDSVDYENFTEIDSIDDANKIMFQYMSDTIERGYIPYNYENDIVKLIYKRGRLAYIEDKTAQYSEYIDGDISPCAIFYNKNNNDYYQLVSFYRDQGSETFLKKINTTPMVIKVNSGDNKIVNLNLEYFKGTIDWGDGQTDDVDAFNRMELKANFTKIASINSKFKIADVKPVPYYVRQHTYDEANKEYEIQINGITPYLNLSYSGYYDDEEDEVTDYQKITSIEQWGSVGAIYASFSGCKNLKTVADPTENTFEFGVSLVSLFENCKSLESIPTNLFSNCKYLEDCSRAFYNCTGLTKIPEGLFDFSDNKNEYYRETFAGCINLKGEAPMLWKNAKPSRRSRYKGYSYDNDNIDYEDAIPDGDGCFGGCDKLNNYDDIPDYWKYTLKK